MEAVAQTAAKAGVTSMNITAASPFPERRSLASSGHHAASDVVT
jgi:hypothetical protein